MKGKLKRFFSLLLIVVTAFSMCIGGVNADSISNNLTIKSTSVSGSKTPVKFPATFHVKKTSSGKYVYCTYYAKKTPSSGIKYTKSSMITDNGMNYILKEAYKNVNSNNSFFIYQTALWIYMVDRGKMPQPYATLTTFKKTVNNSSDADAKKIRSIVSKAKSASKNDTSAPTISFGTSSVSFSLDSSKKNYVSSKIKVNSSTSSYKVSFSSAPSGTTYKISNGYLYIYVPVSSVSKLKTSFKINISNSKTVYKSYTYKPSSSSYQTMAAVYKQTLTDDASLSVTLSRTVSVPVNKVDSATNKAVSGAKLQVVNSSNKVIDTWTSDGKTHTVSGLVEGTYTLKEVSASSGYNMNSVSIKFTVDANGKIKDSSGKQITSLTIKNVPAMKVVKVDSETGKMISGAKLQITNSSGTVVDTWTSDGKEHIVKPLTKGTYTLSEVSAPSGYVLNNETIKFTVDDYGNMKDSNGKAVATLTMKNSKNSVSISKQDITTSTELEGATLEVKDSNGKVIDKWVSTKEVHKIYGIPAGKYTLTETIAPGGYELSTETIKFSVDKDGKLFDENCKAIDKVIMYNKKTVTVDVQISKQDITTSQEVAGAHLVVKDSSGNIVDEWDSTTEVHIIKNMKKGTYTLTETIAPEGYILSKETITFSINEEGSLVDKNGEKISKIVMYNERTADTYTYISKQDITTSKELAGAHLVVKDSAGNVIDEWDSTTEVHKIKNMKEGTYTLTETIAPEGYELSSETITFSIDKDGKLINKDGVEIEKVIMYNKPIVEKDVEISKQDITTSSELAGAHLVVKDSDGNIIDEWDSATEVHKIKNMKEGTYTLTETIAPEGYILSEETIKFVIDANGRLVNEEGKEIDKVIMYNTPKPKTGSSSIIKQDAVTREALEGATLVIKNASGEVVDEWVSTKEAHVTENLPIGTYTLSEKEAPKGYVLSSEVITFIINDVGEIVDAEGKELSVIVMYNQPEEKETKVSISKQDITNGKELAGAHLMIKDSNGNVVYEWISSDTPHMINTLKPGVYTLTETIAPDGYILSTETITFTVKDDGEIVSVIMYNTPKENPEEPVNPGVEIEVENTGTSKNIFKTLFGIISITFGLNVIKSNYKKKEY